MTAGKGGGMAGSCCVAAAGSTGAAGQCGGCRHWSTVFGGAVAPCPGVEVTALRKVSLTPIECLCAAPRALLSSWGQKGTLVPSRVQESQLHQAVKVLRAPRLTIARV